MKYRLKDRELQKKLDEISDGDFSARLHKERELIIDSFKKEPRLHVLWFGEGSQFSAARQSANPAALDRVKLSAYMLTNALRDWEAAR